MKIFLAQQNYHIGNIESNTQKIITAIQEAKANGGDLIVFSELSICGYAPKDFLEFDDFIKKCYNLEKLEYWKMPTTVYSSIFKELKTYKNNYLKLNYVLMTSLLDEDVDQDISKKIIEDLNCKHNITFDSVPHFFIWSKNRFEVFNEVNKFLLLILVFS